MSPQQAVAIARMMLDRAHHTHNVNGKEWHQFFSGARDVGSNGLVRGEDLSGHCHRSALFALGLVNEQGMVVTEGEDAEECCSDKELRVDLQDGARDAG